MAHRTIVFITNSTKMGGSERQVIALARHLHRTRPYKLKLATFDGNGPVSSMALDSGMTLHVLSQPHWDFGSFLRSLFELRRLTPDLLLPYSSLMNVFCGIGWRLTGAVSMVWNQRVDHYQVQRSKTFNIATALAPFFFCNSEPGLLHLKSTFNLMPERLARVRNSVELPPPLDTPAVWRKKLQLPPNAFVAVMVANFMRHKDHPTLLRAWERFSRSEPAGPPKRLVLCGRFDETYEATRRLSTQIGVAPETIFLDHTTDIAGLMGAADVGILSSSHEGTSNALAECMLAGLPVLANASHSEFSDPNIDARQWTPPGDPEALATGLSWLYSDPTMRVSIGKRNQSVARRLFDPAINSEQHARLIDSILDGTWGRR